MKQRMLASVSGGRTSGVMAKRLKESKAGEFDIRYVFANTGWEHEDTLRFVNDIDRHFGLVKALHAEGVVHVDHWRTDARGRLVIAVFALGAGVDAPKRKPKTGAQRAMAYKNRKSEQPLETLTAPRVKNPTLENVWMGRGA